MANLSIEPNPNVEYCIVHGDEHFLVVEKPAGVVTQPGKKHERNSLMNGLFAEYGNRLQNLGEARDFGLLHRLDKDTSGLIIVALTHSAFEHLLDQFKRRLVKKVYWAIVLGMPKPAQGVIQKPIKEVVGTRKRAVLDREGQQAITSYRVLQSAGEVSLVEARPKTGRLHQIRVHLASLGHPLLGETDYAAKFKLPAVRRLCLHEAELSVLHPASGHRLNFQLPFPADLRSVLSKFGLKEPSSVEGSGNE